MGTCSGSGVLLTVRLEIEESKCSTSAYNVKENRNQELACIEGKQGYAYLRDYPGRTHEFKLMY